MMVGDTEADIGAGKLTGLRTAAVLSGIRNREFLLQAQPDSLLNDIRELPFRGVECVAGPNCFDHKHPD